MKEGTWHPMLAGDPGDALPALGSRDAGIHPQGYADPCEALSEEAPLVSWQLVYTRQAQKDARKLASSGLRPKAESLLTLLREDRSPPFFEKLVGDLDGAYSRRINVQHRLVYQVLPEIRTVKILRVWTHYG